MKKRLSNKKRKLEYITDKNHYRKGGFAVAYFNVSNEMMKDYSFVQEMINKQVNESIEKFNYKYKLNFASNPLWVQIGESGEGFLRQETTIKYRLKVL